MNTVITPTRTRKSNVITMKDGFALIHITSKKHGTFIAQIDLDDLPEVSQYCWCVKYMKNNWSYYAYTSVRQDDGSIYQSGR